MKKILFLVLLSLAARFAISQLMQEEQRERLAQLPANMMEKGMAMMPEESPPKVMLAGLRRIQEQNDELLGLLRERLAAQEA